MAFLPRTIRPLGIDLTRSVPVFNRTSRVLTVICDGRSFPLEPGINQLPAAVIPFAQRQFPRLGTWEKGAIYGESLIGVPGVTPEVQMTPLLEGHEHHGTERIDRDAFPHARPVRLEPIASERTAIDVGISDAVKRSAIVSTNDNGALPAPTLEGAELI